MEFSKMLQMRESCRSYDGRPASREDLKKIVEAGALAPSGCNAQPWKFIIVDEEEALEKLRDALVVENGSTGAPWRGQVSSYIIVVETPAKIMPFALEYFKDTQRFAPGDLGMAVLNMCYQALDLGLQTCIIGMRDQKKMEKAFGIPEGYDARMILAVGYPKEKKEPRKKMRKAFEEICSFNSWE